MLSFKIRALKKRAIHSEALSIRYPSSLRIGRRDKCLLCVMAVLWFTAPSIHGTLDRGGDSAFPDCSSNHSVATICVRPAYRKSDTYPSLASCHSGSCQYSLPTCTEHQSSPRSFVHSAALLALFPSWLVSPTRISVDEANIIPPLIIF